MHRHRADVRDMNLRNPCVVATASVALLLSAGGCAGSESDGTVSSEAAAVEPVEEPTPTVDPDQEYLTEVRAAVALLPDPFGEVVTAARLVEGDRRGAEIEQQLTLDLSLLAWDAVSARLETRGAALDELGVVFDELVRLETDQVAMGRGFDEATDGDLLAWGRDVCQAATTGGRTAVHEWAVTGVADNLARGVDQAPQALLVEEFDLVADHLCPEWFR